MVDDKVVSELKESQDFHIKKAVEHLLLCEKDINKHLSDFVAALCEVPKSSMLSNTHVAYCAHARYLYWYAYRYMTNESYEKIAAMSCESGHKYTQSAIATGVNKMSTMIEEEPLWNKRWLIIKRIIKLQWQDETIDNTIVIQVPKDLKGKINITIKDK